MDATTPPFLCLEAMALALALYLLLTVAFRGIGDTPSAADGLSITVAGFAALIGVYRISALFGLARYPEQAPSTRAVFTLSGFYLTLLWAILHLVSALPGHLNHISFR
jgi:hypothetical protein